MRGWVVVAEAGKETERVHGHQSLISPAKRTFVAKLMTPDSRANLLQESREQALGKFPHVFPLLLCTPLGPREPCPFPPLVFGSP